MIGNIYTQSARESWATVPGRDIDFVNDENGNPTKITFIENDNVVFVQYLTYDDTNSVVKIQCRQN